MQNTGLWLVPLILLPGVALVALAASVRYAQLHREYDRLWEHDEDAAARLADGLIGRAERFRNALVALYVAAGLFAVAAFLGGWPPLWVAGVVWAVRALTVVGVVASLYAVVELIREASLSVEGVREHCSEFREGFDPVAPEPNPFPEDPGPGGPPEGDATLP